MKNYERNIIQDLMEEVKEYIRRERSFGEGDYPEFQEALINFFADQGVDDMEEDNLKIIESPIKLDEDGYPCMDAIVEIMELKLVLGVEAIHTNRKWELKFTSIESDDELLLDKILEVISKYQDLIGVKNFAISSTPNFKEVFLNIMENNGVRIGSRDIKIKEQPVDISPNGIPFIIAKIEVDGLNGYIEVEATHEDNHWLFAFI